MPFLSIIPALFDLIGKFIGPAIQSSDIMSLVLDALQHSKTGASIVTALEGKIGPIETAKKQEFTLQLDALLGQIQIDTIEAQKPGMNPRDFLFWGLDIAFLLSVLVEPTINYVLDLCHVSHIPEIFIWSPLTLGLLAGLCGLHIAAHSFDKYNES